MSTEFVPWGYNTRITVPIALTGGTAKHCRSWKPSYEQYGWRCATYRQGDPPTGLRLQAQQAASAT